MLLKYLLVAVIFYFVYRASKNLMRAVRGELDAPSSQPRFGSGASSRRDAAYRRWQDRSWPDQQGESQTDRRSSSESSGDGFWGDVEDAKWEDL